jgi:hypothetical protein
MVTSKMASLYQPLLGNRGIRLLVLADEAIRPGQVLRCKLEERDLDRVLPWDSYSALSYVWGYSTDRVEISCNDCSAFITMNLYHALVQIWSMTPQKRLWADALCINQEDDVEKKFQVGMMGDIYRQAGAVIIWFGETNKQILSLWDSIQANESYNADDLDHFLQHAWFYRAWTLQEVLLAPKTVALCGPAWIDWNRLKKCVPVTGPMKQLQDCNQIMQNQIPESNGRSPLSRIMLATLNRGAQDTRDKVYALLGLLPGNNSDISPDYEITAIELYKRVFRANYSTYGDLMFLHGVGSGWTRGSPETKLVQCPEEDDTIDNTNNPQKETLPSWTLDLADISKFEQIQQRNVFPLIKGAIPFPRQAFGARPGAVGLAGVPIGILDIDGDDNRSSSMCRLRMLPRCICHHPTSPERPGIARIETHGATSAVTSISLDPKFSVHRDFADLPPASELHYLINLHGLGQCSCTKRGLHLDLPRLYFLPEAQDRDMVCILSEGDGCFLLRPITDNSFRVVGSAFRSASSMEQLGVDLGRPSDYPFKKVDILRARGESSGIFRFDII